MRSPVQIWVAAPKNPAFSAEKAGFFAFQYIFGRFDFRSLVLTTEQATDRKRQITGHIALMGHEFS